MILSSAYELYADLLPKHASQPKNISQLADESQTDRPLPKEGSSGTENLKEGMDSNKTDVNSGKMEESSRKKDDKSQEKDHSSPKEDSSPEANSSKRGKASARGQTKFQQNAEKSSKMAERFKVTFSRPGVRVHFIGVWCVSTIIVVA
jgi:hypothetical protein